MTLAGLLALTVTWDPTIRGILVVGIGIVVLNGSVYLLLATNTGSRLGFLIAAGGLAGWMTIMGLIWTIYGIGLVGPTASWQVTEVVRSPTADDTANAELDEARDLSEGWDELPEGDPARGEAQATADEALIGDESSVKVYESSTEYQIVRVFERGGKDPDGLLNRLHIPAPHPEHYAVVQVQGVVPVVTLQPGDPCPGDDVICIEFGETPPSPTIDPNAPIASAVMIRDLGAKRLPPALITIGSGLIFAIFCYVLHTRDKLVQQHRAEAEADPAVQEPRDELPAGAQGNAPTAV